LEWRRFGTYLWNNPRRKISENLTNQKQEITYYIFNASVKEHTVFELNLVRVSQRVSKPHISTYKYKTAVLFQGELRDVAVYFDTYPISQPHRAVSQPEHGFLVALCLQTAMNHLPRSDKYPKEPVRSHF